MADADIGQTARIVGTDRDISHHIRHEVVDAAVPAQRGERIQIGEAPAVVVDAPRSRDGEIAHRRRQRSIDSGRGAAERMPTAN
jgi:hypothetical protein